MSENKLDVSLWPSVNQLTNPLVQQLINNAKALRVKVEKLDNGATIIDAGIKPKVAWKQVV